MIKYDFLEIIQQLELTQSWLDWLCGRSCRYLGPCAIPGSAQLQLSSTLALRWLQARASATLFLSYSHGAYRQLIHQLF